MTTYSRLRRCIILFIMRYQTILENFGVSLKECYGRQILKQVKQALVWQALLCSMTMIRPKILCKKQYKATHHRDSEWLKWLLKTSAMRIVDHGRSSNSCDFSMIVMPRFVKRRRHVFVI